MKQNLLAFKNYAKYYDEFYNQKDYQKEALFLKQLLNRYNSNPKKILELGSGTCKLSICLNHIFESITCVDSSSKMIELAKNNIAKHSSKISNINIIKCDIRELNLKQKYDLIFAFFHVASYCNTNECLKAFFRNASAHLKKDSLFIFDYWYGPAVIHQKPSDRKRLINLGENSIERSCKSKLNTEDSTVNVKYNVSFKSKDKDSTEPIIETHTLRYLFLNEINLLSELYGFEILTHSKWLDYCEPSINTWSAYSVLKKK